MHQERDEIPDVSEAYHQWNDLFLYGLKMALSTSRGTRAERQKALERFLRGNRRALEERDAMWERILASLGSDQDEH